ncbi:hypothetical protein ABOM_009917 [Aspergillus bombycis]|uniref:Cellobiose dehydrogenase-like cytochrome domain-containing protein n=1 Tax=Aspergillus bombycis TaxID=109264 RepID=A0A1F7ZPJ7_9EURO|nr:hypothetical protein ABOM_009917 [Aspergillus bombycis]OGM41357.1 hypothetical protein ABOM_009917 [Aspergillus bombycis]
MARTNMFILYSAFSSNVNLSPRSGQGHFPPVPKLDARVSLLDGSGIQNGMMTANALCENCNDWQGGSMDPKSSSIQWIYAYKEGLLLDSDNTTELIQKHDGYGGANTDLSHAKTASTNPCLTYNPATGLSNTTLSTGSTTGPDMLIAHGFIVAITFVLLFPSFALAAPRPYAISIRKVRAPLQILALALVIAGMGVGLLLAVNNNLTTNSHTIIGIIIVVLLTLFQPVMAARVSFLTHIAGWAVRWSFLALSTGVVVSAWRV